MKTAIKLLVLLAALAAAPALAQNALEIPAAAGGPAAFLRVMPSYIDARVLAANTNENHTVPTGARFVIFSSSCAAFYAKSGGTAAVPAADVTNGSGSELNPSGYYVVGVTTIGLISPTTCIVTLSFYL